MVYNRKQLAPTIGLHCMRTDKFKTEMLSVSMIQPVSEVTSTVMPLVVSLLTRGTEKYPTQGQLNRKLETLYGTTLSLKRRRLGNRNIYGFSAWMLGDKYIDSSINVFPETLDVISQMLFHPLRDENGNFSARYIDSEKVTQCDAIESVINNPRSFASKRCNEIMFEGDPYGISFLGTPERVCAIENEELNEAYQALVYGSRYEFFYVGAKPFEQVEAMLREQFLPYLSEVSCADISKEMAWERNGAVKEVDETMPLSQSRLVLGFRTGILMGDDDFYPMTVCNEIYGFSPISKLFMNVRERLGLCYQCGSTYDSRKGVMFASSGIDSANRDLAQSEMLAQLAAMQKGEITQAEFEAAKKSLQNACRTVHDSPSAIESFYITGGELGIQITPEEYIAAIESVTLQNVIDAAKKVVLDTVYFLEGTGAQEESDDEND